MNKTYIVEGMSCVICKNTVETGLKKIEGINDCKVNLLENEVYIDYDENLVTEQLLQKTVADLGYKLIIQNDTSIDTNKIKIIVSSSLALILMAFSMIGMFTSNQKGFTKYIQLILCTAIIIINNNYYRSGFKALINKNPNMDSLVSLSSLVSYVYSLFAMFIEKYHLYFETSAMVLVIVSVGKYVEGINKNRATKTIRGLATLIPMQANLYVNNEIKVIPIDELKVDDIVVVKPGESIPQDGLIVLGSSQIDESMITGESMPVNKSVNDEVIGGTVNCNGEIIVKITKRNTQTTLSKIISLTKQATMTKIPVERLADIISKHFVKTVIGISIFTFILWLIIAKNIELALNFSLSVLVISCPCALGLATPSAVSVATGKCASNGILIKNPEVLEIAGKIKYLILDKTGTLTKNKLEILDIQSYDDNFINVLSSLERLSNHPIASTILDKYPNGNIVFDHFEQVSSQGIIGYKDNDVYFAGNLKLASKYINNIRINNNSYILVGKNNKLLGIISVGDILKQSSYQAIASFYARDITPIMCTGDNNHVAKDIANRLSIKDYISSLTPKDKNDIVIEKKKAGVVAMVGDGINDAIALSSADVSISLANGTDIAYATSDVVLMSNEIDDIAFLIDVSRKTMSIIKQNLFWALFYNAIFIPIAAGLLYKPFGLALTPIFGSVAMCFSSIIVITNSLRINSMKKQED